MNKSKYNQSLDGEDFDLPANQDIFSLPFDEFQRYRIVAEIINLYRENQEKFTILDVGSGPRQTLKKFLPTDTISFLDKEIPLNYRHSDVIVGDITSIEITQIYDFVVSSDTFEHIFPESRQKFIQKLLDFSKVATIIAAPFNTSGVRESELLINDLYKSRFGVDYSWLKEHIQYGLPNLEETIEWINRNPRDITVIPNGYLPRWSELLSLFLLNDSPTLKDVFEDLFKFYNEQFYKFDNQEPAYRHVIIINKINKQIEFKQLISKRTESNELENASLILTSLISSIKNGIVSTSIKERNDLKNLLTEKEQEIQRMVKDIETLQKINIEHQNIEKSISWRCVRKIQRSVDHLSTPINILGSLYYQSNKKFQKILEKSSLGSINKQTKLLNSPDTKIHHDIICFPIIDWDFRYQRPQQILSRLAKKGNRIFYLPVELLPESDLYSFQKINENIYKINISVNKKINIYSDNFSENHIDKFMEGFDQLIVDGGIDHPICFVEFPAWQPIIAQIQKKYGGFVIFDCLDEYSDFSNINSSILDFERKLSELSDLTIATSHYLIKKCEKFQKNVFFLPNAGDFAHFSNLLPNNYLKKIKKPIFGYYGAIAEWFDSELIEYLASNRPEWNFIFIGNTFGSDISHLKKYENIHFLGERSYQELPKYLFWFDVCLIPFRDTPLIKATHPVKFYEYLSSGKPVVSTNLPELIQYSDLCYIARSNEEFLERMVQALEENDPEIIKKRILFAENNTWDHRVNLLLNSIESIKME